MFETLFYQPILNLIIFIYNIIPGGDLGITIMIFALVIKILLFPISQKALKSQKELQELQPKIQELKVKFKDQKEEMGKAMMKLYKDNKVNPFSSCMLLLIQMPFLFAVFKVFSDGLNSSLHLVYPFNFHTEVVGEHFFSLDLTQTNNIVLALSVGVAQFWQTKMMMVAKPIVKKDDSEEPDMATIMNKQMLYVMPVMIGYFSYTFSSGLALYWLVTTILTGVQQLFLFNKNKKIGEEVIEGEIVK